MHFEERRVRWIAGFVALAVLTVACRAAGVGAGPPRSPDPGPTPRPPAATAPAGALVASVRWVILDGRSSLEVTPTPALRGTPSRVAGEAAWSEVVRAVPSADTAGMEDQLVCHVQFASAKPVFHLEPWRPAVGYLRTVVAACNPGPLADSDLRQ